MAYTGQVSRQQKLLAGGGALIAVVAVGFGLASGLDLDVVRKASEAITAIALPAPPPPRKEVVPVKAPSEKASGKASAANKHAKAAAVAAPPPKLPPITSPIAAAPRPGTGNDASAGATPNPGPGSGAGGRGDGTGAGGAGSGTGGGTKAIWRSGTIRDRDYPREASRAKAGGEVEVRFTIETSGRVSRCRVTRSSGDASLDATTCDLIEERFRFKPATNAAGEPIASQYGWRQSWWLERRH
ncbi:energy transducer TonB [Sphingopyxis sp. Root214]|uniref:energy transducer TonB n=1 Tax=unclassified Sphingopyxis TaxID=2614943 RepID=UPI0006F42B0E|nr:MULTISPECIES: energy transducer TonB [unclassified Sphingopyxis]KQZ71676.1 energy transducer TonB [Sphingopyxis sp. Root154]KRC05585.1 energy transducer TonB [Sphingopyxis sp. Root214]